MEHRTWIAGRAGRRRFLDPFAEHALTRTTFDYKLSERSHISMPHALLMEGMAVTFRLLTSHDWDSWLHVEPASPTRNADLYLIVRIEPIRWEPSTGYARAGTTLLQDWGDLWAPWKRQLKTSIESLWNDRLWLVPDGPWGDFPSTSTPFLPNVNCSLDIQIVSEGGHCRVVCCRAADGVRSPRGFTFGAWQRRDPAGTLWASAVTMRSDIPQIPAAHEFGHYLNRCPLDCPGWTAADAQTHCYGVTARVRADRMGLGSQPPGWHAAPWIERLNLHLAGDAPDNWTAATTRPTPRTVTQAQIDVGDEFVQLPREIW